jgi:hypothetical protein
MDYPLIRVNLTLGPDDGPAYSDLIKVPPRKRARRIRHLLQAGAMLEPMGSIRLNAPILTGSPIDTVQRARPQKNASVRTRRADDALPENTEVTQQSASSEPALNEQAREKKRWGKHGLKLSFLDDQER